MKWEGRRQSSNMEDRRSRTAGKAVVGGGIIGIIFLLIQIFSGGGDPNQLLDLLQSGQTIQQDGVARELTAEERRLGEFCATILADTEDVWHKIFNENGMTYREPKMVLFKDAVRSGCGGHSSNSGPFYCPADETVYMDLSFFEVLQTRFGAKGGDFAIAYVIAHEVGHHVQHQLGILKKVHQMRQQLSEKEGNKVHVAMELQADFYAGLWAHHIKKYLEEGDIEEALSAAAAVGSDAIQMRTRGYVVEESFTHGSSAQRVEWFKKGFKTGRLDQGDTFKSIL